MYLRGEDGGHSLIACHIPHCSARDTDPLWLPPDFGASVTQFEMHQLQHLPNNRKYNASVWRSPSTDFGKEMVLQMFLRNSVLNKSLFITHEEARILRLSYNGGGYLLRLEGEKHL